MTWRSCTNHSRLLEMIILVVVEHWNCANNVSQPSLSTNQSGILENLVTFLHDSTHRFWAMQNMKVNGGHVASVAK